MRMTEIDRRGAAGIRGQDPAVVMQTFQEVIKKAS